MQPPINIKTPAWIQEFQAFIMKGPVVDLAVGVIIGAAFSAVVGSLVKDLFTPVLGLLLGGVDFSNLFITLKGTSAPTLEAAKAAGAVTLNIGLFLNAVINFLIIGFAIFWMVKMLNTLMRKKAVEPPPPPGPTPTEALLTEIRDLMKHPAA